MTKTERAKLGGLGLLRSRGKEYFTEMGKRGGRPRSLTYAEICLAENKKGENVRGRLTLQEMTRHIENLCQEVSKRTKEVVLTEENISKDDGVAVD